MKGGEIYRYAQEKMTPKSKAIDILNICKKSDAITVDEKKATEIIDYLAAQDKLQMYIIDGQATWRNCCTKSWASREDKTQGNYLHSLQELQMHLE